MSSPPVHFADFDILTPGDAPTVLVAMNPAALKANLSDLPRGATIIVNTDEFSKRNLTKVGYTANPLEDGSLDGYAVHPVALTSMTVKALEDQSVSKKDAERAKNMFALGLLSWLYSRPHTSTIAFLERKFASRPELVAANVAAFNAGWAFPSTGMPTKTEQADLNMALFGRHGEAPATRGVGDPRHRGPRSLHWGSGEGRQDRGHLVRPGRTTTS